MKNKFLLSFILITQSFTLFSQKNIQWSFGGVDLEIVRDVEIDFDHNIIVTGSTNGYGQGDYDIMISKLDTFGNNLWVKTWGSSYLDNGFDSEILPNSKILITGTSVIANKFYVFLSLLNKNGNEIWKIMYEVNHLTIPHICSSNNGDIYLISDRVTIGYDSYDITKLDTNGVILWTKNYSDYSHNNATSHNIKLLSNNNLIIVGSYGYSNSNEGRDSYAMMIDTSGSIVWSKSYFSGSNPPNHGNGAILDVVEKNGKLYFVGQYDNDDNGTYVDILLIKTDLLGNQIFSKRYYSIGSDQAYSAFVSGNEITLLGKVNNNSASIKVDTLGNVLKAVNYNNNFSYYRNGERNGSLVVAGDYLVSTSPLNIDFNLVYVSKPEYFDTICNQISFIIKDTIIPQGPKNRPLFVRDTIYSVIASNNFSNQGNFNLINHCSILFGCTDSLSINYNPNATVDNGSCIISGCTDSLALNYNPNANYDNGECMFTDLILPEFKKIIVSPNPFNDYLGIYNNDISSIKGVVLYNCYGSKIDVSISKQNEVMILNTFNLVRGVYYLRINDIENTSVIFKLLK